MKKQEKKIQDLTDDQKKQFQKKMNSSGAGEAISIDEAIKRKAEREKSRSKFLQGKQ